MRKKVIPRMIFTLIFTLIGNSWAGSEHLQMLKMKYPFGLIGDDFGILKEQDLAINACDRHMIPFSEASTPYQYWQCFNTTKSKAFCDGNGYDESEKKRFSILVVAGTNESGYHEYFHDRVMPLSSCREYLRDWKHLTKGQHNICISGEFVSKKTDEKGRIVFHWDFDRFKTKKGCDPYFVGGCSFKYQLAHGCKIEAH